MPLKLKELRNRADETARTMQVYTHVRHVPKLILVQDKDKSFVCVRSATVTMFVHAVHIF
jgi:hypothetical protein